jgi:hypothetical protein
MTGSNNANTIHSGPCSDLKYTLQPTVYIPHTLEGGPPWLPAKSFSYAYVFDFAHHLLLHHHQPNTP